MIQGRIVVELAARQTTAKGGRVRLLHNKMPAQSKPVIAKNLSRTGHELSVRWHKLLKLAMTFIMSKRPAFYCLRGSGRYRRQSRLPHTSEEAPCFPCLMLNRILFLCAVVSPPAGGHAVFAETQHFFFKQRYQCVHSMLH